MGDEAERDCGSEVLSDEPGGCTGESGGGDKGGSLVASAWPGAGSWCARTSAAIAAGSRGNPRSASSLDRERRARGRPPCFLLTLEPPPVGPLLLALGPTLPPVLPPGEVLRGWGFPVGAVMPWGGTGRPARASRASSLMALSSSSMRGGLADPPGGAGAALLPGSLPPLPVGSSHSVSLEIVAPWEGTTHIPNSASFCAEVGPPRGDLFSSPGPAIWRCGAPSGA